jgi:hypothetical protein
MNSLFLALESTILRLNRICLWVKSLPPEARATRGPLFVHLLEAGSLGTLAIGPMEGDDEHPPPISTNFTTYPSGYARMTGHAINQYKSIALIKGAGDFCN